MRPQRNCEQFAHLHQLQGPCLGTTGHWCQTCLIRAGGKGGICDWPPSNTVVSSRSILESPWHVTPVVKMLGSLIYSLQHNLDVYSQYVHITDIQTYTPHKKKWNLRELRFGRWFPFSIGSSSGSMLVSGVLCIQSGRNNDQKSRWKSDIFPALVASSWKAASSSSQACNLHWSSGCNISNSRSWPYYCLPSKRGGIKNQGLYFLDSSWKRERESVERNPSPVYLKYEVQWRMISYNWGGLEGQGSGESAVHIEPICNTHFNQTCDPPRPERKGKKLSNSIHVYQHLSLSMVRIIHQLSTIRLSRISPYPST